MLISESYQKQNQELHNRMESYGVTAHVFVDTVRALADGLKTNDILDYGCGKGLLKKGLGNEYKVKEYDPGIIGKERAPIKADIVVCIDVLEHIEPDCIDNVLADIASLATKNVFLTIHSGPAKKSLSDGRNAHLIQKDWAWWKAKLQKHFTLEQVDSKRLTEKNKEFIVFGRAYRSMECSEVDKINDIDDHKDALRVFIGHDPRQEVSYTAARLSIERTTQHRVSIEKCSMYNLPMKRSGLTPFTYARFMVPWMSNYEGWSVFMDADIMLREDISELFSKANDKYKVMVAKGAKKFEWAAVMLFNNAKCKDLTPEFIESGDKLHGISWAKDNEIGDIGKEWNHLVGYDTPNPHAKLVHFTQGVPAFPETEDCEFAQEWQMITNKSVQTRPWIELMGSSVHAAHLEDGRVVPKYKADQMVQEGHLKLVNS